MKILVAMDSMKGCLDAFQASFFISEGLKASQGDVQAKIIPVSDGGEGMVDMIAAGESGVLSCCSEVRGPLDRKVRAKWIVRERNGCREAFMEFAAASGITLLAEYERNPLHTSSYGVGEMIKAAFDKGVTDIKLGLGGSATVDGGLGSLQALGVRLIASNGEIVKPPFTGGKLNEVSEIEITEEFMATVGRLNLCLLCDVEAPFTGERGAARVFGPQKGASEDEVELLEKGMEKIRELILMKTGIDLNQIPGSGAAGGAAGGLMALAGGKICKGAPTLLDNICFDNQLRDVDLIITGEGSSDRQTLMGKIPFEILRRGKAKQIPVWLVAGRVKDVDVLKEAGFDRVVCINSPEIVAISDTDGKDPMDPDVAAVRLRSAVMTLKNELPRGDKN